MTATTLSPPRLPSAARSAGLWSLGVIGLTTIHHVWGAILYDTPFRLHIVYVAVPIGAAIALALWVAARRPGTLAGRIAVWLAAGLIIGFCAIMLGLYEGGYNHLVKIVAYFTLGPIDWFFGDAGYQIPNDPFFEITGVAHLPAGVAAAIASWRLLRELGR